ncbi:hypothetical protein LTR28_011813, partial [Elasticomyces elasticus]
MCARRSDPTNDPSTVFSQHQHTSDGMNAHQQLPYANGSMQQLPPPSNHTAPVGQLRGNTEPTSGYRANHQFSEVDGTYFILTVDLWNEQGTGE